MLRLPTTLNDTGSHSLKLGARQVLSMPTCLATIAVFILLAHKPAQSQTTPTDMPAATTDEGTDEALQEDSAGLEDIDLLTMEIPVVVTATRREQKITNVPYAVSVITADDIRLSGARNIPDALRLAPGVDVADLAYGQQAVSPRGFHGLFSNKTLVLVDSREIFDTIFNGTLWNDWPFQLEDIERIEVIRGPGGVTWGANAVNGVINVITKDPADQLGVTLSAGGASRGTHKEYLSYAFQADKLRLRVSGEYEGSDGFKGGGTPVSNFADNYQSVRSSIHGIYDAGPDDTLTFSAGSSVVHDNWPLPWTSRFDTVRPGAQSEFMLGKWTHRITNDNVVDLTGFFNDFHVKSGPLWCDYRYQQFALQLSQTFKPADAHTLSWGIDTRLDLTDATNADPFMLDEDYITSGVIGIYLQDEWRVAPKWVLSLGGRIDYDSYGGFQPSGRASLAYELSDDALVYAAVSRAFHMPTGARRLVHFPTTMGLMHILGKRGLDPEKLIAYELGYRGQFLDNRLEFGLNGYWHQYSDLIAGTFGLGPPGLMRTIADNEVSASLYGVEMDTRYRVNEKLTLLGNYTFQIPDSRVAFENLGAMSPPKHKFMLGARYSPTDDLHLSSHLYYVDSVFVPDANNPITPRHVAPYFRLDLRAEHDLWNDRASIAVGVRNLLDPSHYEGGATAMDVGEVPRMVYAEMRFTFE